MLHIHGITRRFGPRTVFENLSWHIGQGMRIGLVGPNGAGKTTLLRILAGADAPDAGDISLAKGTLIGYLPQEVETLEGGTVLGQVLSGFVELRSIEEEIERIEERLAQSPNAQETDRLTARYGDLRHRFEALGGYGLEGQARSILGGLGFATGALHAPLDTLSGGWRMRAALAGHLLRKPDLLLLDEPTNHLDLEEYEGSVVIVSHDRFFLNRVVDGIAELEDGRLALYPGDYDDYLEDKEARRESLLAAKKQQDRQIAQVERFIERFRYKATKARQVQSRVKALEKVERIRVHRGPRTIHFAFPQPPRSGAETIRVEGLRKAYGEKIVYAGADFVARRGDRIGLVGPNGAGKTTLLKILAGTLPFEAGTRIVGHNVTTHYYAQHQLEALGAGRTVLEEIETVAPDEMRPRLRSILGAFLFSGDDVDKKVGILSGGEKARLALAKMLLKPASLLLLDEPTNHLDLRARGVLEEALDQYTGTIVFISHDRYFINRIATSVCDVKDGRLDLRPGSYDDYMDRLAAAREEAAGSAGPPPRTVPSAGSGGAGPSRGGSARAGGTAPDPTPRPGAPAGGDDETRATGPKSQGQKRLEAEERNRRHRETRVFRERLTAVEKEIAELEARQKAVGESLADPALYRDGDRARDVSREHREIQERIAWLYDEWAHLEETLSGLE